MCMSKPSDLGSLKIGSYILLPVSDQPTGAIATFMSSIYQGWAPPMEAQDEMVDILVESYMADYVAIMYLGKIVEYDTSKPGKHGAAKARIVGVGIFDGQKRPHVGPVSMQIHIPLIQKKTGQIISIIGSDIQVMDSETFETVDIELIDEEVEGKLEQSQDVEYWDVMGRTKIMRIKTS